MFQQKNNKNFCLLPTILFYLEELSGPLPTYRNITEGVHIKTLGGGKTFALLIDALGLNEPQGPRIGMWHYRALIYRKQYSHLTDLIDKSKQIYPHIDRGAKFNHSELVWTFTAGAQIRFDYFENITQAEGKLIGKEFAAIYCEELGLFETDDVLKFCQTRLRSPHGLKCYFRASCNPSKNAWLQKFFRIPNDGSSTKFILESELPDGSIANTTIKYIQSKLNDNPHLGREYLEKLSMLDEADRQALINGVWGSYIITDAMVYRFEYQSLLKENRLTTVRYEQGHDVYAAFDLGFGDNTSVIIFQIVGKEIHIIESFQSSGILIDWYADEIKRRGYKDATIILPHDAKQHSLETGKTIENKMKLFFTNVTVLERLGIEDGIAEVKRKFPYIYIDKTKNEELTEAITAYEREYNAKIDLYGGPLHNKASHFADALRYCCVYTPEKKYSFSISDFRESFSAI